MSRAREDKKLLLNLASATEQCYTILDNLRYQVGQTELTLPGGAYGKVGRPALRNLIFLLAELRGLRDDARAEAESTANRPLAERTPSTPFLLPPRGQ